MGTFAGHAIPGTAFVVWGAWWYGGTLRELARRRAMPAEGEAVGSTPDATTWEPPAYVARWEPYAKIAVPVAGAVSELWWASWRLVDSSVTNYQHATMYLFFALAGAVDLLERRRILPPRAGVVALFWAFLIEGVLFLGHPNPPGLEARLHLILVCLILGAALLLLLELRYRRPALTLVRSGLVILQGTWFWQIAVMLYAMDYDPASHANVMRAHLFLAWHAWLVPVILVAAYAWSTRRSRVSGL